MIGRNRFAIFLGVAGLAAAALVAGQRILGNELSPVGVGDEAPDFHAVTLDPAPREKSLAQYRGDVVMINIWATWCVPCRVEMPSIEQLHRAYGPQGLKVIAVSVDEPGTENQIRDFVKQYGLTFEILHDPQGQRGEVARLYQTTAFPETVIVGRDGLIRKKLTGASDWNSPMNRYLVARLLEEKPEAD